ncbi:hypothetical protein F8388_016469 [Cannabis sativa]|uniref:DUF4283 domain-containing protein n=1 Tax=Cannabis sativa TaxID=3483 RepID=A0A7J6GTH0_CANSA|nr:hypothetical protein F8388_016469 [Cannabis sativa]
MIRVWNLEGRLEIKDLPDDLFLFTFHGEVDLEKVETNGPWNFKRTLLLLQRTDDLSYIDPSSFTTSPIWVRVLRVPFKGTRFLSEKSQVTLAIQKTQIIYGAPTGPATTDSLISPTLEGSHIAHLSKTIPIPSVSKSDGKRPMEGPSANSIKTMKVTPSNEDDIMQNMEAKNVINNPTLMDLKEKDHRVLAICLNPMVTQDTTKKRKRFMYEALWNNDDEATHIIVSNWKGNDCQNDLDNVIDNIQQCSESLSQWHQSKYEYYQELFTSIYPTMEHIQRITDYVPKLVFEEMNMTLLAHFTSNEVFQALNAIAGEKSLGEEESGVYTVKSGYSLAMNSIPDSNSSSLLPLAKWWRALCYSLGSTSSWFVKVKCGCCYSGENGTIGLGALVRDSNGFPLRCFAKSLTGFFSLKEAEALAISYALKWCLELGFFVSFVESDAEIIVNSVNSSLECVSQ